jgi:hypothetical protein
MKDLLYYPYINLPRTDWTLRTLLYYESVGSIVPDQYFYHPDNYEPFMLELVQNRLVVPINPMEVLDNPWEVTKPFIEHIEKNEKSIKRMQKWVSSSKIPMIIHEDKFSVPIARIHQDKFHNEIFYSLMDMGLATPEDGGWYAVEKKTADLMMKFLATVVGSKNNMLPTTDKIVPIFYKRKIAEEQEKRQTILKHLIPMPQEIDLNRLIAFKERHIDLLDAFKTKIEILVHDPSLLKGTELFNLKVRELEQRRDELTAKMNESQFGNIIFGTVCGLISAATGLAAAGTWGAIAGAFPGFANAVHSALQIESPEKVFDQTGLKYLALADKRLRMT